MRRDINELFGLDQFVLNYIPAWFLHSDLIRDTLFSRAHETILIRHWLRLAAKIGDVHQVSLFLKERLKGNLDQRTMEEVGVT